MTAFRICSRPSSPIRSKAVVALKWAVREMEERYRKMSKLGVRGVEAFNERVRKAKDKGETLKRTVQTGFDRETGKPIYEDEVLDLEPMPFIVVVVDEMADLMMISGKEIEGAVQRLAQMARAAGIHLIAATQRPSVDVITGTIKANFPTRISLPGHHQDRQPHDPRRTGRRTAARPGRHALHDGRRTHPPRPRSLRHRPRSRGRGAVPEDAGHARISRRRHRRAGRGRRRSLCADGVGNGESGDDLYDKALAIVARERKATTSYIQRRLQIGYNRAASLIERMEEDGVISKPNHQGMREVLLPDHDEH